MVLCVDGINAAHATHRSAPTPHPSTEDGVQEALQLKRSLQRLAGVGDHAQLLLLLGLLLQAPAPTYGALHASQIAAAVWPLTKV